MRKGRQHISALAALVLFGLFAGCVLAVLLTGAGAYRRLTDRDRASCESRTRMQYVAARVRQADGVTVEEFAKLPALRLAESGGYVTWVYCWDGWLTELYTTAESELGPEAGARLTPAAELSLRLEEGLLEVDITGPEGTQERLYLSLRSQGEGTP